jgi:plasmid stabilization system protein ParE
MPLPVRLHPKALEEAEAAVSWYRERSQPTAERFLDELDSAITQVALSAGAHTPSDGSTRHVLLRRFPYMLIFRERAAWVEVIAVAHLRRKPGYWRERLN